MSFLVNPFVYLSAGATLTADKGTFTLTGVNAAFLRSLKMEAGTGTFTLTGQNAGLSTGHPDLVANAGTFTLTGNAAALSRALRMAANTGTFSLTGNAAALSKTVTMLASGGSFTLTGVTNTFKRALVMAASQATFTLTGNAATLTYGNNFVSTLTVASGEVSSNLTSFVVMVDLADMPTDFWSRVKSDGGDVRVYQSDGTTMIPHDLVSISVAYETGLLFFKSSLLSASDNVFKITCGDSSLSELPATDANGRNAVWDDYERVHVFAEGERIIDRTGNGADLTETSGSLIHAMYKTGNTSPDLTGPSGHVQGIATDGTYFYVTWTNRLRKYDSSWNLITDITDPLGATGIAGVDHIGDPAHHNGLLYLPVEVYPSGPYVNQHIAVFDASDLSFVTSYDISAQGHEVSAIAYNPDDNSLYVVDYTTGTHLHKYSLTGVFQSNIALSTTLLELQGADWFRGKLYLSKGTGGICEVETSGTVNGVVNPTGAIVTEEGICSLGDGRFLIADGSTDIFHEYQFEPYFARFNAANYAYGAVSLFTSWTMAASVHVDPIGANGCILNYADASANNNTRATLAARETTPDQINLWDTNNSWLTTALSSPAEATEYRCVVTWNGTTERELFVNGASVGSDATVTQKPGGASGHRLMIGRTMTGEPLAGSVGFVYLRSGVLSDAWIAAENASWRTPDTFYTIA